MICKFIRTFRFRSRTQLDKADRITIERGLDKRKPCRQIARKLDRSPSTVVDLAAEADIEDVMLCDAPGILSFLGLPAETEMPPDNKGKTKLKKLYRKAAPNRAYHSGERAKSLISHLDMAKIRASAPIPLEEIDRAIES